MIRTINGERIRQAREIKGLTQAALAERIGVTQSYIAHLERDAGQLLFQPSDDLIEAIAIQTGFAPEFFRQESGPEFPLGSLLYRKRSALTSGDRDSIRQTARLIYEVAQQMMTKINPIPVRLPKVANENPSTAARITRTELGLSPDTPVKNLLNQLEKNGVCVLAVPFSIDEQDAFSLWADSEPRKPVVILSEGKPGDRQRFSLAHELGHLVMHYSFPRGLKVIESEADQFAAEFLMPEESMLREILPPVTLTRLAELKLRWGVAISALAMRAKELGIITERQARYLFVQMRTLGWDKAEPANLAISAEKPRAFKRMAEVIHGAPVSPSRIAAYNKSPVGLIKSVLAAHADKPIAVKKDTPSLGKVIQLNSKRRS